MVFDPPYPPTHPALSHLRNGREVGQEPKRADLYIKSNLPAFSQFVPLEQWGLSRIPVFDGVMSHVLIRCWVSRVQVFGVRGRPAGWASTRGASGWPAEHRGAGRRHRSRLGRPGEAGASCFQLVFGGRHPKKQNNTYIKQSMGLEDLAPLTLKRFKNPPNARKPVDSSWTCRRGLHPEHETEHAVRGWCLSRRKAARNQWSRLQFQAFSQATY